MPDIRQIPHIFIGHGRQAHCSRCAQWTILGLLLASVVLVRSSQGYPVDGDSIGPDSSTTDNTGGFTAVRQDDTNLGQPAILVSLGGQELLTELRVIVFGGASISGDLYFDDFDYRLDVWQSSDYFADGDAEFHIDLGEPIGIQLVLDGATRIIPSEPFGTAGVGGGNATTYDLRFDLTRLPSDTPGQSLFASPLASGDWVFGFQSWHDPAVSGVLRVSGSVAEEGPLPLFSRDNGTPRGVLGGQDPNNIALRWGLSLEALPETSNANTGDFNGDGRVDAADYVVWRQGQETSANEADYQLWTSNFGNSLPAPTAGDVHGDGYVDTDDYPTWRVSNISPAPAHKSLEVPEPSGLPLPIEGGLILILICLRTVPTRLTLVAHRPAASATA